MTIKVAAVQLCGSTDPTDNAAKVSALVRDAADRGADYVQTPEVTNLVQLRRKAAANVVTDEENDVTLAALRQVARERQIVVHIGSLVIDTGEGWRNRAFVIDQRGDILARYDKVHMFDVDLPSGERYRESATFTPGDRAVLVEAAGLTLGIAICFDVRFPALFAALSNAGANVLTVPAAFSATTGKAHWHTLLRARAIENGAFLIAAAQSGHHDDGRDTYGHSLIIDPWGRIVAEATETPSVILADIDLADVDRVRSQIPVLTARRTVKVERPLSSTTEPAQ